MFFIKDGEDHVPDAIRKVVQKQNVEFLHHKAHFNLPYFQFIKQLLNVNAQRLHQCMEHNEKLTVSVFMHHITTILMLITFKIHVSYL